MFDIYSDFYNVLKMVRDRLSANPVPIVLPIGSGDTFSGLIDLINDEAIVYKITIYVFATRPC